MYAAGIILHPNRRTKYIEANWEQWVKPAIKQVKELWKKYREQAPVPSVSSSCDKMPSQAQELDAFDQTAQELEEYPQPANEDEFEDYCYSELCDIGERPALTWWCEETQRQRWPRLSYMAIDILSVPGMSDEPERVFSAAHRTVSWDKAEMEAEALEKRECLKHWKQTGIITTGYLT
jgi:hypothetical protein